MIPLTAHNLAFLQSPQRLYRQDLEQKKIKIKLKTTIKTLEPRVNCFDNGRYHLTVIEWV